MNKKTILMILMILTVFILSSCDLEYDEYISFYNYSSYKITVKCDVTKPSSFTLEPDESKVTKTKVNGIAKIDIKIKESKYVRMSVSSGNVYFKDK